MADDMEDVKEPEDKGNTLALSDREMAIARGEDPDQPTAVADQGVKDDEPAAPGQDGADRQDVSESADSGGKEAAGSSWVDDDTRHLAAAYGLSEEDLKGFDSSDEFRKAASLIEKRFVGTSQSEGQTPEEPQGTAQANDSLPELDPDKYAEAGYDEETVAIVKHAKAVQDRYKQLQERLDKLEPSLEQVRKFYADQLNRQTLDSFHSAVDELEEQLFGRSVDADGRVLKLSESHDTNRRKVWDWADKLKAGIEADAHRRGVEPAFPPDRVLIKRAAEVAFADELRKLGEKRYRDRISAQARRKRAAGTVARAPAPPSPQTGRAGLSAIVNSPDIVKAWDRYQEENGAT